MTGYTVSELMLYLKRDLVQNITLAFDPQEKGWQMLVLIDGDDHHFPVVLYRKHTPRIWVQPQRLLQFIAGLPRVRKVVIDLGTFREFLASGGQSCEDS